VLFAVLSDAANILDAMPTLRMMAAIKITAINVALCVL
jgi:hypothetical protein